MTLLGEKLKELRGSLSLYEVGEETGIPRIEISRYERGQHLPTPKNLRKIAEYYEVPYEVLRLLYFGDYFSSENEDRPIVLDWAMQEALSPKELEIIAAIRKSPPDKRELLIARILSMLQDEAG